MKFNKNKKGIIWLIRFIIIGFFVKKTLSLFKKREKNIKNNFEEFIKEEEEEVEELISGKESFKKYCNDSFYLFKNYFIPNNDNNHKPKILHSKSLLVMALSLLLIKSLVTGYLFFIYPNQAKMTEVIVSRMLELINSSRIANDLPPLNLNNALSNSAQAKAEDMINNDYFAHYGPDGKKPWDWIIRADYPYFFVGENLAMNFSSADSAHKALMLSPSHKENILNDRFSDIGLAVVSGEIDGEETNVLVEFFATQKEKKIAPTPVEKVEETDKTDVLSIQNEESNSFLVVKEDTEEEIKQTEPKQDENIVKNKTIKEEEVSESKNIEENKENNDSVVEEEEKNLISATTQIAVNPKKEEVQEKNESSTSTGGVIGSEEPNLSSPNKDLEFSPNTEIKYFSQDDLKEFSIASLLVKTSKTIYIIILGLLIILLGVNIFVRITVQHKSVIIQTFALIVFVVGLISIHVHFLEGVLGGVAVL